MKRNKKIILLIGILIIIAILTIYPYIEFKKNNKLYKFTYSSDWSEFEENMCYGENYSYNEERNITISGWDIKEFFIFKVLILDYKKGNICATEYLLEEEYINKVINEAQIIENEKNIDLSKLIEGKTAIVGNKKYFYDEDKIQIIYQLNGKEEEMFIFYIEDLLIIQIGLTDEGPKFIAYK